MNLAVNKDINYCDALKVSLNSDSLFSQGYSRKIYPSDALSTHSQLHVHVHLTVPLFEILLIVNCCYLLKLGK